MVQGYRNILLEILKVPIFTMFMNDVHLKGERGNQLKLSFCMHQLKALSYSFTLQSFS